MFSKVRSSILAAAVLSLLVTCKGFSGVRVGAPTRTSRLNQSTLVHNRRLVETSHPRVQTMDESPGRPTRISVAVDNLFKIDKSKIAKLGANFVLSYSVVSTINGAVSLSVAWYIASIRTGLSPLIPGQWKSLLAAYGALYAVISLMRPLRVAAAIGMSKTTERFLDEAQARLGCPRGLAMFIAYALGWVAWAGLVGCGVSLASACSGVPVWAN